VPEQPEKPQQPVQAAQKAAPEPPPPLPPPTSADLSDHEFTMTEVGDELDELPDE
jgi:hypothetical protein